MFTDSTIAPVTVVAINLDYTPRPFCVAKGCDNHASYLVKHDAVFDGVWRHVCSLHLAYGVASVGSVAKMVEWNSDTTIDAQLRAVDL